MQHNPGFFGVRWLDTAFFLSFFLPFFLPFFSFLSSFSFFLFSLSFLSCCGERVRNERKDQSGVKPPHSKGADPKYPRKRMPILPVLDLMNGQIVRGIAG